jgi:predicted deacetylase
VTRVAFQTHYTRRTPPPPHTHYEPDLRTLVSIHDVMPATLPQVLEIVDYLEHSGVNRTTLLVIPGAGWSGSTLAPLMRLQGGGHELAGHGWTHLMERCRSAQHKIYSALISRNAAEHLALAPPAIRDLITRCYQWFLDVGLQPPRLYVPPAWAMGPISRTMLRDLPFAQYEYLSGVYDIATDRFYRYPLVGFEANTRWRVGSLRLWNHLNIVCARRCNRPLRIAIHPNDLTLPLHPDLTRILRRSRPVGQHKQIEA